VIDGLGDVVEEFESELERRPTSAELLSLLRYALRTLAARLADIAWPDWSR